MSALPPVRIPHPHVEVRDDLQNGSPVIAGTRIHVRRIWAWHRRGVSVETLLRRYPSLRPEFVLDALAFAYGNQELIGADLAREEELISPRRTGA